jgi:RNA polymerase sigma-70 factor (ECF subfamily)
VVLLSAQSQAPGSRAALSDLCKLYWYPLYAFIRRRGYNAEDAQDLTQGFFSVCWIARRFAKSRL